jgi:hypothetical protein
VAALQEPRSAADVGRVRASSMPERAMRLLAKLKRRNVIRMAGLYLVGA